MRRLGSGDVGNECETQGATAVSTHETQPEGYISILTARARKELRAGIVACGKARLRLRRKTNAVAWKAAAHASTTMPKLHRQGPASTFDFADKCHPWANIHCSHEVWFCDLIAFCRCCGSSSSKKGTLQKVCKRPPERVKGKAEPHGRKVVRFMSQGRLPRGTQLGHGWEATATLPSGNPNR